MPSLAAFLVHFSSLYLFAGVGHFFFLQLFSLGVWDIVTAGWAANSKYHIFWEA